MRLKEKKRKTGDKIHIKDQVKNAGKKRKPRGRRRGREMRESKQQREKERGR